MPFTAYVGFTYPSTLPKVLLAGCLNLPGNGRREIARMLRDGHPREHDPILVVNADHLVRSLAPFPPVSGRPTIDRTSATVQPWPERRAAFCSSLSASAAVLIP